MVEYQIHSKWYFFLGTNVNYVQLTSTGFGVAASPELNFWLVLYPVIISLSWEQNFVRQA